MKALRGLLKFLGYSAFFLVALVFFVYLTLPLEEVEDYLVRKAADEYSADLTFNDEDSLATCGLTCVEATNVTMQFRASPEEQAEFEAQRKVYLDWRKAQQAAAQGKSGGGGSAGAPASTAKKDDDKKGDAKSDDKGTAKLDDKDAPQRPENPSKTIELDRLKLAAAPLKLIGGALDGTLEAELIGGTIEAAIVQGEEEITLAATLSDLDASQLDVLRQVVDLPIVGTVGGDVDLRLPLKEDAKGKVSPDLTALTGTVGLMLANVAVGPGQIKTNSKTGFPFFDVPKTRIAQFGGQIVFARKRATFEKFKMTGKDLEGELTGYGTLMPKVKDWRLNAHLNLKFSDAFLSDNRDVKVAMNSSPYLRKGQSDGYTGFNIHGTVGNVKFRPRKKVSSGSRGRSAKSRASKRPRGKTSALNRKGRTKRPSPRSTSKRSTSKRTPPKRTDTTARVASPTVRKGRPAAVMDEPEPEDEEPEPEGDEEPEAEEPEGDEEGEEKEEGKEQDEEKDEEEGGDEEDAKDEDEEKEE